MRGDTVKKLSEFYYLLPIHLLCLAFFLNDFVIGSISEGSFSDIFVIIGVILTFPQIKKINYAQLLTFLIIMGIILSNIFLHLNFGGLSYEFSQSVSYVIKVPTYLLFFFNTYNFIIRNNLANKTLDLLSFYALIICILGIYINLAIPRGLPYEFLWAFTRQDAASYSFQGTPLIRMRSLASEPQYLGILLTAVLSLTYFNNIDFKIGKKKDLIITVCSFLTFSFSTIITLVFIKVIKIIKNDGLYKVINKKNMISIFVAIVLIIVFWDQFYNTFIIRASSLLNGEDTSGTARLSGSWDYVNNLFMGNGIGNTPPIWNNFAYVLSDFGIVILLLFLAIFAYLTYKNPYLGVILIFLSFQRGGYLAAYYWCTVLLFFVASSSKVLNKKKIN